jgi:hypothetical protein
MFLECLFYYYDDIRGEVGGILLGISVSIF